MGFLHEQVMIPTDDPEFSALTLTDARKTSMNVQEVSSNSEDENYKETVINTNYNSRGT